MGTLIAVYLSTSDEMLPIFLSESVPIITILKILGIKFVVGMLAGFVIDLCIRKTKPIEDEKIEDLCEKEHCHCEHGIFRSALKHTINILIFILIVTIIINLLMYVVGEERISSLLQGRPILGILIAGLIGLIPNCAASVILTQMYLENIISIATVISGLLVGAGVGLAVLFKMNRNVKQNIKIISILYIVGVLTGLVIEFLGVTI